MMRTTKSGLLAALAVALGAALAHAQPPQPRTYYLRHGSTVQQGCFNFCACLLTMQEPLIGKFVLTPTLPDPVFQNYAITDASFFATMFQQHYAGTGRYQVGGDPAALERMTLDMSIDGISPLQWDTQYTTQHSPWPAIHATLTINQYECYDIVLTLRATPLRSDWNADGVVRLSDVFVFLTDWFAGNADANGDEQTNMADVFAFVTDWFAGG